LVTDHQGRINIKRIARDGGVAQAALPCTYLPRLEDCFINQALLEGFRLGARLTGGLILWSNLRRLAALMQDGISSVRLDQETIGRLRQHKYLQIGTKREQRRRPYQRFDPLASTRNLKSQSCYEGHAH
jgi:hypothetical protein